MNTSSALTIRDGLTTSRPAGGRSQGPDNKVAGTRDREIHQTAQRAGMGRLGLAGFLTAFTGTYLIAMTGNFGFLAPVVAKQSPAVLDSISQYSPVVIVNGLAAILFMIGYVLFGIAVIRVPTLPRWSGVLVAVGAPAHLIGFGVSQLVSTAAWSIAILGSVSLGAGLAWSGHRLWRRPAVPDALRSEESTRA